MSDTNLKFVIALARSYNLVFTEVEKNVQEYGLNSSEFGVLEMLLHKGTQPVQKIAEKILVTSGTVTYVIDKLEKKDLVFRKKCEKDRRIIYVSLTEKGKIFITEVFQRHKEFLDNLFQGLNDDSKKQIIENLVELQKSMDKSEGI